MSIREFSLKNSISHFLKINVIFYIFLLSKLIFNFKQMICINKLVLIKSKNNLY